jgi:hypothetical protein
LGEDDGDAARRLDKRKAGRETRDERDKRRLFSSEGKRNRRRVFIVSDEGEKRKARTRRGGRQFLSFFEALL